MAFDLKQIAKYYKEDMQLNFALEEENNRIRFSMDTEAMKEVRFMAYKENPHTMLFLTYLPMKVEEDKRAAVAEYLTRANYGLHVGNFEMDMTDGEVRYKTTGVADENTMPGHPSSDLCWLQHVRPLRSEPAVHPVRRQDCGRSDRRS